MVEFCSCLNILRESEAGADSGFRPGGGGKNFRNKIFSKRVKKFENRDKTFARRDKTRKIRNKTSKNKNKTYKK